MKGIFGSGTNDFLAVRISSLILFGYFAFLIFFMAIGSDYLTLARLGNFGSTVNKLYRIFCALIIGSITLWSLLIVW